jgi:hypothetical protein
MMAIFAAFGRAGWRVSHLALFPEPNVPDISEHLVLMGVSAGSVCWFAGGTTDAFGLPLRPVTNGEPLAKITPIRRRQAVPKEEVFAIFSTAPVIDVAELRSDLDAAVAQDLRDPYEGTDL